MGEHPVGLVQVNPARYGSLSIPSDDYSFDIFSQAAGAVGTGRARSPIDPLDGLEVRHLVAFGGSQSASRLGAYINAVQPRDRLFDAFLLYLYFGGGSPLDLGRDVFNPGGDRLERSSLPMIPCRIRDDLDALVMIVNSEVEAISCYGVSAAPGRGTSGHQLGHPRPRKSTWFPRRFVRSVLAGEGALPLQ
jgi:alpha/beta hydrolase family protein